ncbi:MAG: tripartite tricarboxylate transporter substrate binding protein [Burkholderiales bacterium]|nr:tripartite tricarboxylate transporter substrate binding protein [Burkholderiales bacterium]
MNWSRILAWFALAALPAWGQDYPSRPIRLVVPYPAGGPVDIMGRLTGQKLTDQLGSQVVIDNRAGANGNIGGEIVARSSPDGYTLLMGANGSIAVNPGLYRKMPYDPAKDLAPVSLVSTGALMMVVHPSLPAKSVGEFVALAKTRPGAINFASSGAGSTAHLCSELLKVMTAIDIVHVPYKGSAPALNDVIGGQVQMLITGVSSAAGHVRGGKLRALGVTSAKRLAAFPEVPTIGEAVPGYEVLTWYGVFVPAGTPAGIVQRLNGAIVTGMNTKEIHDRMTALGAETATNTPAAFGAMVKKEIAQWAKVLRAAGIRPE